MLLLFEDRLPTVCLVFTTRQWFRILRKNVLCINQLNVKSCHFSFKYLLVNLRHFLDAKSAVDSCRILIDSLFLHRL